jgi:hypothetical protein
MGLASLFADAARPFRPTSLPRRFPPPAPSVATHPLAYPFDPTPRTALFGWRLSSSGPVEFFPSLDPAALDRFEPEALAAPLEILRVLTGARRRGLLALASLSHPIVGFSDLFSGPMTQQDRDSFWDVFGLPVFEQWRGWEGELLACECELHAGLHIQTGEAAFEVDPGSGELLLTSLSTSPCRAVRLPTGYSALLETRPCGCGNLTPRLTSRQPLSENS